MVIGCFCFRIGLFFVVVLLVVLLVCYGFFFFFGEIELQMPDVENEKDVFSFPYVF